MAQDKEEPTEEVAAMEETREANYPLAAARLDIDTIPKDGDFGDPRSSRHYKYATADDVYKVVGKALATQGLAVWCNEVSCEITRDEEAGKPTWIHTVYDLAITPNGLPPGIAYNPVPKTRQQGGRNYTVVGSGVSAKEAVNLVERLSFAHPYYGVQSFAAIRTYAIKAYLRGKMLLDTGEKDADEWAQDESAPYALDVSPEDADPEATGEWVFHKETRKFTAKGEFSTPQKREAALYASIRKKVLMNQPTEEAIAVYTANKEYIEKFSDAGRKNIVQLMNAHSIRRNRAQERAKEQEAAPEDEEPINE